MTYERVFLQAASVLFATLPNLTLDDAITDFLAAYELRAEWLENLVYIGRCYVAKKDKVRETHLRKNSPEFCNFSPLRRSISPRQWQFSLRTLQMQNCIRRHRTTSTSTD